MKNIKQQFQEFRSSTPKHVQWLLLVAAIVIVVILFILIFASKSNKKNNYDFANQEISFDIYPKQIDFKDVIVGESDNQDVKITVNTPVILDSITTPVTDITTTHNCDNLTDSCLINVIYKPRAEYKETNAILTITWHAVSDNALKTETVPIVYSSHDTMVPIEPQPVVEPIVEPVIEPVKDDSDDEQTPEEDEPISEHVVEEIEEITPDEVFDDPKPVFKPESVIEKIPTVDLDLDVPEFVLPPEKCSDFAIPGYDQSGIQIGWIKPERGANYFHPFTDTDCTHPTGKYDFATGIITSLTDGSRIGTDVNHIGYREVRNSGLSLPSLSEPTTNTGASSRASNGTFPGGVWTISKPQGSNQKMGGINRFTGKNGGTPERGWEKNIDKEALKGSGDGESVTSSRPYDRTFILRQFKPIPATIVSEVRADPSVYGCNKSGGDCTKDNYSIPVRATVDRNVFSDDGRTIIIPTGTLLMGYLDGDLPGPYQAVGRMNIRWYQFIRPDGVEFNFKDGQDPYSGDAQGRMGVPGHGSTDYMEQMVMPILTSLVPAAVNMIAPIADTVINQIDLDNNTIVQSGTMRSSEMAKREVIDTWNKVAQKLLVDVMANTTPPFSIAAGTRINVFSPVDLIVTCDESENAGKKCAFTTYGTNNRREWSNLKDKAKPNPDDGSWVGQVRSFNLERYCTKNKDGKWTVEEGNDWMKSGYDYRTVYVYCESMNYQAINTAKSKVYAEQVQQKYDEKYGTPGDRDEEQTKAYNEDILGLKYNSNDEIINPFGTSSSLEEAEELGEVLTCDDDGTLPDANGCCPGETFEDMGPEDPDDPSSQHSFACCPAGDGDCFPPIGK